MAKPAARILLVEALLALGAAAVVARSFMVQVVQHDRWAARVRQWREHDIPVAAQRGRIFDRNGRILALSEAEYRVSIALNEVSDTVALRRVLQRALGVSPAHMAQAFEGPYPYFYGPFTAEQFDPLRSMHGVHPEILYNRVYPMQTLAAPVLGRLDTRGLAGIEGVEAAFDTLLQGKPGVAHVLVDGRGNRLAISDDPLVAPVPGRDVYLTIDSDLQGVVEGALRSAVEESGAHGGDIVVLDAPSGEILAVASLHRDSGGALFATSSALVEPNQPGSTSKIFTVAALLRTGADTTPVSGEGGHWDMPISAHGTRTIEDVHKLSGPVTVGETVKYSSNIAISKFAMRLQPNQQYEAIRDFGFGTYPGLGFPAESPGVLRRPATWVNRSLTQPSLGQGYEWEATALQLASGYGAIANHGYLMAPSLLREVRDDRGSVVWRHRPDTVRHAVADSIAAHLFQYLTLTADSGGTGMKAQLARYPIAGKTGTADLGKGKGYRGSYVGLFPDVHPQTVAYVMIDRPGNGKKFGGDVAAPVVKTLLQQGIALLNPPLDRSRLHGNVAPEPRMVVTKAGPEVIHAVSFPVRMAANPRENVDVPDLAGLSIRDAIVMLHRAGLQARVDGTARVRRTEPGSGDSLLRGATVFVHADSSP
jgi:cell division protein FtsI (penicillin-binding protein 3)